MTSINTSRLFNSKILLFGEYLVLNGGLALAIPYSKYSLKLSINPNGMPDVWHQLIKYASNIPQFIDRLDHDKFYTIDTQYSIDSNIPIGYGLGSSGALVALFYDTIVRQPATDISTLRSELALLEQLFHHKSSGIDPLTSYLDCPILLDNDDIRLIPKDSILLPNFRLIDSGVARIAKDAIDSYHLWASNLANIELVKNEMIPISNQIIHSIINHTHSINLVKHLSNLQWQYWNFLIAGTITDLWHSNLSNSEVSHKLCGAGMGGFYLEFYH